MSLPSPLISLKLMLCRFQGKSTLVPLFYKVIFPFLKNPKEMSSDRKILYFHLGFFHLFFILIFEQFCISHEVSFLSILLVISDSSAWMLCFFPRNDRKIVKKIYLYRTKGRKKQSYNAVQLGVQKRSHKPFFDSSF